MYSGFLPARVKPTSSKVSVMIGTTNGPNSSSPTAPRREARPAACSPWTSQRRRPSSGALWRPPEVVLPGREPLERQTLDSLTPYIPGRSWGSNRSASTRVKRRAPRWDRVAAATQPDRPQPIMATPSSTSCCQVDIPSAPMVLAKGCSDHHTLEGWSRN